MTPLNSYAIKFGDAYQGEDRMIFETLRRVGIHTGTACEFGANDGYSSSNISALIRAGHLDSHGLPVRPEDWRRDGAWFGVMLECEASTCNVARQHWSDCPRMLVLQERVTCEPGQSIDDILDRLGIQDLQVLSIDVDSIDLYIFHGLRRRPAVIVVEFNQFYPPLIPLAITYDPMAQWQSDGYFGATAAAFVQVGQAMGYRFVGHTGQNLLFAKDDLCTDNLPRLDLHSVLHIQCPVQGRPLIPLEILSSDYGLTTG